MIYQFKIMTITEFAKKYIPYQEGHSEDLEFLNNLYSALENGIYNDDIKRLQLLIEHIRKNPNRQ